MSNQKTPDRSARRAAIQAELLKQTETETAPPIGKAERARLAAEQAAQTPTAAKAAATKKE